MVDSGEVLEYLFYRLNVIPIWSPPLRERRDDIPRLAHHFCGKFSEANGRELELAEDAIARLRAQDWIGNVRELQNLVERLVVLSDNERLTAEDVDRELGRSGRRSPRPTPMAGAETDTLEEHRKRAECEAVREALDKCGGNRTQAARLLGVSRRTLYNKLEECGIE